MCRWRSALPMQKVACEIATAACMRRYKKSSPAYLRWLGGCARAGYAASQDSRCSPGFDEAHMHCLLWGDSVAGARLATRVGRNAGKHGGIALAAAVDKVWLVALFIVCIYKYGIVRIFMSYRVWLPLLLMLVLAVEGVLGAWASTRMVLHAGEAPASAGIARAATASCDPVQADSSARTSLPLAAKAAGGHQDHAGKSAASHADDCSCADSVGCECLCVFTIYPPATALLFAGAHPPVSADTPLQALELPFGRLSRVFRPPIV